MLHRAFVLLLSLVFSAPVAHAQRDITFKSDLTFYGDNTEFRGLFRDGETLFGVYGRLFVEVGLDERVQVRGGVFGNHRFGEEDSFQLVRPVFALEVRTGYSRVIFGTLETFEEKDGAGPDVASLHGLLPPIQRETLAFTRPYEAGLQWILSAPRYDHDAWLNWQRLNTARERELIDAGYVGRVVVREPISLSYQFHIVHHGGQLFSVGPVSDSIAYAPGVLLRKKIAWLDQASAEFHTVFTHFVPDRARANRTRSGFGGFFRGSGERAGWRGHVIVWRGCDLFKEEGDANYLSRRLDGTRFRRVRDYAEAGVTRTYRPAQEVRIEWSARLHRIENHYEYSYRVLATVDVQVPP